MKRAAAALALALASPAAACEVALALTIDVSGSVDPLEYRLQMDGLAAALQDPTIADALISAQAEVAVLQWSGASRQALVADWRPMTTRAAVNRLAAEVAGASRAWRHFSTAIGDALAAAAELHGQISGRCERQVIDVSGDGPSNEGAPVPPIRDSLIRAGFQINGLAIETTDDDLTAYYQAEVIGGPGAFVLTARTFEDYPRAIRRKLLREVTSPIAQARPSPSGG